MRTLLAVALLWPVCGLALWAVMVRRGFDRHRWLLIGILLGPLAAVPVLVTFLEAGRRRDRPRAIDPGSDPRPGLRVTIGLAGAGQDEAALVAARRLVGAVAGRLTVVVVTETDADAVADHGDDQAARRLDAIRPLVRPLRARQVVLTGQPATRLADLAHRQQDDLLVVVRDGMDPVRRLLGGAFADVTRRTETPVLVVGTTDQHFDGVKEEI